MHAPKVPKLSIIPVTLVVFLIFVPISDEQVNNTIWFKAPTLNPTKSSKI